MFQVRATYACSKAPFTAINTFARFGSLKEARNYLVARGHIGGGFWDLHILDAGTGEQHAPR